MILDLDQPEYSIFPRVNTAGANTRTLPLFRHHFPFTPFYYFSLYRFHFHPAAWETLSCSHLWQFRPFRTINKSISDHSIHILCMNSRVFFACQRKFSVTKRGLLEARGLFFWRASANLGIPQIVSHHPAFLFSSPQTHFRPFCHLELLWSFHTWF